MYTIPPQLPHNPVARTMVDQAGRRSRRLPEDVGPPLSRMADVRRKCNSGTHAANAKYFGTRLELMAGIKLDGSVFFHGIAPSWFEERTNREEKVAGRHLHGQRLSRLRLRRMVGVTMV